MKVLLVNNLYPPHELGGGGRSLETLCRSFQGVGIEPVVVTLHPGKEREVDEEGHTTVYRLPLNNLYWPFTGKGHPRFMRPLFNLVDRYNPTMGSRVQKVIERESPDLVRTKNLYGFSTSVWEAGRATKTPVVHTLGDYYLICLHASLVRDGSVCESQCGDCELWTAGQISRSQRIDGVTGVSRFVLDKHRDFGCFQATGEQTVIPPPMDLIESNPVDSPTSNTLRIGYLGRLEHDKGVDILVDAVAEAGCDNVKLLVGGEGPDHYRELLNDRVNGEAVEFQGYVEPEPFLEQVDVLAVPSRIPETFGRVVVEAFRQNVPVVTSGRGALGELVEHDRNGWIVSDNTVRAWVDVIRRLADAPDELARFSGKGSDVVERCHTDRVARQYRDFFEEILADSPVGKGR